MQEQSKLPEYLNSVLKTETIAFKTKRVIIYTLQSLKIIFGIISLFNFILLSLIFLYFKIETPKMILVIIGLIGILVFAYSALKTVFKDLNTKTINQKPEYAPWFIGTDNFLLIASDKHSFPIPWSYLSSDVKTKLFKNQNAGNVYLKYARKEFANTNQSNFIQFANPRGIIIAGIENPLQIAQICETKIKQKAAR